MSKTADLKNLQEEFRSKIKENDFWAARACLAIYQQQTADEQNSEQTKHENGVGFNARDAEFYSSIAKQLIERGFNRTSERVPLSFKQRQLLREGMQRYAGQLARMVYKPS